MNVEQEPVLDAATMRRMGECEKSVAYWATQTVLWNGQPVTVREPERKGYPINQADEE